MSDKIKISNRTVNALNATGERFIAWGNYIGKGIVSGSIDLLDPDGANAQNHLSGTALLSKSCPFKTNDRLKQTSSDNSLDGNASSVKVRV